MCMTLSQVAGSWVEWHCSPIDAGDGYLMTYGRDPFGNVIEIQQVPELGMLSLDCHQIYGYEVVS